MVCSRSFHSSEAAILRAKHEFVRDEAKDAMDASWETRMAVKYYRRLFKEYALADLSRYKESKIGLRWRTEKEVIFGKGQFICGNKRCDATDDLHSYEVPFRYEEHGQRKLELVKVRVCPKCARKLFHEKIQQIQRENRRRRKKEGKEHRRRHGEADDRPEARSSERDEESLDDEDEDFEDADVHRQIQQLISGASGGGGEEQTRTSASAQRTTGDAATTQANSESTAALERKAWVEPQPEERTRDHDFEDYFADLFM